MCIHLNWKYPCGRCYQCLNKLRSDWSLRLQFENEQHQGYHAILTYKPSCLPYTKNGLPTLKKRDVVLFMKRLRHHVPELKYFVAGEYGSRTARPHYHAVIFGLDTTKSSGKIRTLLQKNWQLGDVRKRSSWIVSDAQLHYVTKDIINLSPASPHQTTSELLMERDSVESAQQFYMDSGLFSSNYVIHLDSDDRVLPFRLVSKGLGIKFVNDNKSKYEGWLEGFENPRCGKEGTRLLDIAELHHHHNNAHEEQARLEYEKLREDWEFLVSQIRYDSQRDCFRLPDELSHLSDTVKRKHIIFDYNKRQSRFGPTETYAMPRYYRERLMSQGLRHAFNFIQSYKHNKRIDSYYRKYYEYDLTHDEPYYLLANREAFKNAFKAYKDRYNKKIADNILFD